MLHMPKMIGGGGLVQYPYEIPNSMYWDVNDNSYLRWPAHTTGDSDKIFTASFWVKRTRLTGVVMKFLQSYATPSYFAQMYFNTDDTINYLMYPAGISHHCYSETVFKDTSAWYHVVMTYDSTEAVQADRFKMWVNGVKDNHTESTPISLNEITYFNNSSIVYMGYGYNNYSDLALAEFNFLDGVAATADDFGQFNSVTGEWIPKRYTGLYGSNGFYLDYSDGTSALTLGEDRSGNNNDFTQSLNIDSTNQTLDTPTNNVMTLQANSLGSTVVLSDGGTEYDNTGTTGLTAAGSIDFKGQGKFYFELDNTYTSTGGIRQLFFGFANSAKLHNPVSSYLDWAGAGLNDWKGWARVNTTVNAIWRFCNDGSYTDRTTDDLVKDDVINVAIDGDTGEFWLGINGTWYGATGSSATADPATNTDPTFDISSYDAYLFVCGMEREFFRVNFGHKAFAHTPPSGYLTPTTGNLPDPEIVLPSKQFDPVLYEGTGAELAIADLAFQPDLVWLKNRDGASWHNLIDSVRGATKHIYPNDVNVETTETQGLKSFDANGFTLGTLASSNTNANSYVAWCWKKGVTPGLDIVEYTGNGSPGLTVAHSLGVKPAFFFVKALTQSLGWPVYHHALGATKAQQLETNAADQVSSVYWNNTEPDASNVTLGGANAVNRNTFPFVMYAFAEIPGFSKFVQYTGNGNANGPLLNLGFKPGFVLIKANGTASWYLWDSTRSPAVADVVLYPDLPNVEAALNVLRMNSNGIKVTSTSTTVNQNGITYTAYCFAETPFKYSRAR